MSSCSASSRFDQKEDRFREALSFISSEERGDWIKVGMGLKHEFGDAGLVLWREWSKQSQKYNQQELERQWRSIRGKGITGATIFALARQNGQGSAERPRIEQTRKHVPPAQPVRQLKPWAPVEDALLRLGYRVAATYTYRNSDGSVFASKVRFEHPNPAPGEARKNFRWKYEKDGSTYAGKPVGTCPPYHLPRLLEHADEIVFVVEGEKDCDRLNGTGLVATSIERGHENEAARYLTGRTVFVIPDCDKAGEDRARKVLEALAAGSQSAALRLPGLTESQDVSDWLDQGNSNSDLIRLTEEVAVNVGNVLLKHGFWTPEPRSTPTTTNYVVKRLLPTACTSVVYGASTVGKSFLTVDLSVAISCGDLWCGLRTRKGLVAYLALEGASGIARRFDAVMRERNLDRIDVMISDAPLNLKDDSSVGGLIARLKLLSAECGQVQLLVIDTLACATAGADTNGPADASLIVAAKKRVAREVGCAVLSVAHPSKNESGGIAGNLRFFNDVDVVIKVSSNDGLVDIFVDKVRDDASKYELATYRIEGVELGVDDEGDPITSAIVRWVEGQRKAGKDCSRQERAVLNHFDQLVLNGKSQRLPGRDGIPDQVDTVCVEDLIERCNQAIDVTSAQEPRARRTSIQRAIKQLQNKGALHEFGKRAWRIST